MWQKFFVTPTTQDDRSDPYMSPPLKRAGDTKIPRCWYYHGFAQECMFFARICFPCDLCWPWLSRLKRRVKLVGYPFEKVLPVQDTMIPLLDSSPTWYRGYMPPREYINIWSIYFKTKLLVLKLSAIHSTCLVSLAQWLSLQNSNNWFSVNQDMKYKFKFKSVSSFEFSPQ